MRTPKTGGGPNLQSPIARSTSSGLGIAQIASAGMSGLAAGAAGAEWDGF